MLTIPLKKSHLDPGVIVDVDLKLHDHIHFVMRKARQVDWLRTSSRALYAENLTSCSFFLLPITPIMIIQYCPCIWSMGYKGDLYLLETVQKRWTTETESLHDLKYSKRLLALNLYSVKLDILGQT